MLVAALLLSSATAKRSAPGCGELLPMEREHKDAIFARLYANPHAVVQSMIVTSANPGRARRTGLRLIADLSFPTSSAS